MQRDFLEPGGFGASLGNDVTRLQRIVPAARRALDATRAHGMRVVHDREGHDSTLSDCPPSKRRRGTATVRIAERGPTGRLLVRGEPGREIILEPAAVVGEWVITKPGKARSTPPTSTGPSRAGASTRSSADRADRHVVDVPVGVAEQRHARREGDTQRRAQEFELELQYVDPVRQSGAHQRALEDHNVGAFAVASTAEGPVPRTKPPVPSLST